MNSDKDFLTYRQQMRHLRDDKSIECRGTGDKELLCRYGYFNLINGYKTPFVANIIDGKHYYIKNTNIAHFYSLKNFDDKLRNLLLRYIVIAEEEARTLTAYKFDQLNEKGNIPWYSVEAYDSKVETKDVVGLISKAYSEIGRSQQDYVQFYMENHKFIPSWILLKAINFSTFIDLVSYSKIGVRKSLCELYNMKCASQEYDFNLLIGSLHWMRKIRNACAHNERIYCMKRKNGRIETPYFDVLPKSYKNERQQKIFDLLIYLRYYLDDRNYETMVKDLKKMLIKLKNQIPEAAFNKVRGDIGIKDLEHLDILIKNKKVIPYKKFESYFINKE